MAENKILPWAQTGTANVLSDADYASDVASGGLYGDGVKTGQASSKQANKTWRQATAPGSGLAQFLVDNLGVDVTDADTPSTFSSRIANAVLKLAQVSPFNQAWATATGGYRKYAIVSDSSGNFWVSTADQNATTPGASGAKWQDLFNGYATQVWADGRFQPAGDYATNTALNTETTNRTNADTNLQNQINNRIQKTGDTMNGTLTIVGEYGEAHGYSWSDALILVNQFSGSTAQILCTTQYGVDTAVRLKSTWGDNKNTVLDLHQDGKITTTYGTVAFESDISNLQNQINGKQPAGNYVSASVYSDDFSTSDSRVINLAYGHRIQAFKTGNVTNGDTVTFPTSFSSVPSAIICQSSRGDWDVWAADGTWTSTGFTIAGASQSGGYQPLTVIAIGPK